MTTDTLIYQSLDDLQDLSLEELRALWDLVPTDRQRIYKAAYEKEVHAVGASGSDQLEQQVNRELARRYTETALVPAGSRWARTPTRVQQAAAQNEALYPLDTQSKPATPNAKVVIAFGLAALLFGSLFILGRSDQQNTAGLETTELTTETPTPEFSPTPTPLALEAQDEVIEGGDRTRAVAYPVNLQVAPVADHPPRVWVVQRRVVNTSEWIYDDNPDTASFINGLVVRPIIGIPWSEENAQWFATLGDGTTFNLTLNTGAILRYEFVSKTQVRRSETEIFRQISPGLVLLLLGETDENGLPTATRTLITARYPPEQELRRDGAMIDLIDLGLPTPVPTFSIPGTSPAEHAFANVHVDLVWATFRENQLNTKVRIYNGGDTSLPISATDLYLILGYTPNPLGPQITAAGIVPFELQPAQAADVTLDWPWTGEPYAALHVTGFTFALQIQP
jgi:hypothetical protein